MAMTIRRLLRILRKEHGDSGWWPGRTPFEIAVGAILTQNTAWRNVEIAIGNLSRNGLLTPKAMKSVPRSRLEHEVRPAGFYRQKSRYLSEFSKFVCDKYHCNMQNLKRVHLERMRKELLEIPGIGDETADSILLYALGKPSFVVDTYTRRLLARLGMNAGESYDSIKSRFEKALKNDVQDLADMHALIVMHCKERCRKNLPSCEGCPLHKSCHTTSQNNKN